MYAAADDNNIAVTATKVLSRAAPVQYLAWKLCVVSSLCLKFVNRIRREIIKIFQEYDSWLATTLALGWTLLHGDLHHPFPGTSNCFQNLQTSAACVSLPEWLAICLWHKEYGGTCAPPKKGS